MKTLSYIFLICTCSIWSLNSAAQSVFCNDAVGQRTTITIVNSTPNGANFDFDITIHAGDNPDAVSSSGVGPYSVTYTGDGTLVGAPISVAYNSTENATIQNVPNGGSGVFDPDNPSPFDCTTPALTFSVAGGGSSSDIPTLSEWGLIILALLLMTLGVLYQLQPRFRKLES